MNEMIMARSKTWIISDIADIADFISPTFINPCFRYSPIANIENLDLKKSEIFKHPCFRYSPIANIESLDLQKSEIFKHPSFRYSL